MEILEGERATVRLGHNAFTHRLLDEDTIATLADRALYDAKPLSGNGYKVDLAASLLRRVIAEIA